jgi:hypothetical protein
MKRIILGLTLVVAVAGCSRAPDTGTVVQRKYEAPYVWTTYDCISRAQNGTCTVQMPVQHPEPERYRVKVRNADKEGWHDVSRGDYDRYAVGDCYPLGCESWGEG